MSNVVFNDFSIQVKDLIDQKASQFLEEAAIEIEAAAKIGTPTTEPQLKGSWEHQIDAGSKEATIGSPLESALWNEFGTGSYAEHGDGRKGWWVYIEGQGRSAQVSKSYATEAEANEAVEFLRRVKGLPAVASNGKPAQKTLRSAFARKKETIIARARQIFGGDMV